MTRLNPDYYTPTIDTTSSLRYQPFSTISVNTEFDPTGAYALCGGEWSPICNAGIVYGGDDHDSGYYYDDQGAKHSWAASFAHPILNYSCERETAPLFMTSATVMPNSGRRVPDINLSSSPKYAFSSKDIGFTGDEFWKPANSYSADLAAIYPGHLLLGFPYKNYVMRIYVEGKNSGLTEQAGAYLDEYNFYNYPNITKITGYMYFGSVTDLQAETNKRSTSATIGGVTVTPVVGTSWNHQLTWKDVSEVASAAGGYEYISTSSLADQQCYNLICENVLFYGDEAQKAPTGTLMGLYTKLVNHKYHNASSQYYYVPMTRDTVCKVVATYGLYFTGDETIAKSGVTGSNATSSFLYCPVPDSDGVFRGNYVSGTDIATAPNADWGGDVSNPYIWWDGEEPGVKNIYKGDANVKKFYFGANTVSKIYLGDNVIYSEDEEPEPPTPPEPPEPTSDYATVIGTPEDPDATPTAAENYTPIIGEQVYLYDGTYGSIVGEPQSIES